MSKSVQGFFYITLCILLWSLIPTFAKFANANLDFFQYLFYSSVVSFLSLLFIAIYKKSLKELVNCSKKTYLLLFMLGFLDFLYYLLLYFGYEKANALEVLVIQYMWPIFIVILSIFLLQEPLNKQKIFAMIFGFIGVSLVVTKGQITQLDFSNLDVLFVVMIGTFCFALFSVLSKRVSINPINAVMIYFFSAVIYATICLFSFSHFVLPSPQDWIAILVNGVFLNGVSYLFWIKGLQIFHASKVAPYLFITPVLSAFFIIIFFNEKVLPVYIIGLILVIISGVINSRR